MSQNRSRKLIRLLWWLGLLRWRGLALVIVGFVINVVIQVPTQDAVSNTATWFRGAFRRPAPKWLDSANADQIVHYLMIGAMIVGAVWFVSPLLAEVTRRLFGAPTEKGPIDQRLDELSFHDADVLMNFSLHGHTRMPNEAACQRFRHPPALIERDFSEGWKIADEHRDRVYKWARERSDNQTPIYKSFKSRFNIGGHDKEFAPPMRRGGILKIPVRVPVNQQKRSLSLLFYVPNSRRTFEICKEIAMNHRRIIDESKAAEIGTEFVGPVRIFHERTLKPKQLAAIKSDFQRVGGDVRFVGERETAKGRKLSAPESQRVREGLKRFAGQRFRIEQVGQDNEEAVCFAEQLAVMLRECGWIGEVFQEAPFGIADPPSGLSIELWHQSEGPNLAAMNQLRDGLNSLGIRVAQSRPFIRQNVNELTGIINVRLLELS